MTRFLALSILIVATGAQAIPAITQSGVEVGVGAISKYVYNVFYDANRAINDAVFDVSPELHAKTKEGFLAFQADADALLENFAKNTIQNHTDFSGGGHAIMNKTGKTVFKLNGNYRAFSDPSPTETFGRDRRSLMGGDAGIKLKGNKGTALEVKISYALESFSISPLASINADHIYDNTTLEGVVEYSSQFLPETSWFFRVSGGTKVYPNKPALDPNVTGNVVFKNDSLFALGEAGFVGRLSERSTVDFAMGLLDRSYAQQLYAATALPAFIGASFFSPVFYARFAEQVTRRDQFTLGYDYKVEDSYFTNFYLDQEIYAGLVRVLGDQVLILTRLGYDYRSYSLPFRRDDIRITASFSAKYSLTKTVKLTADLKIDMLSSDAFDNSVLPVSPDRPMSYRNGSFALGILATY